MHPTEVGEEALQPENTALSKAQEKRDWWVKLLFVFFSVLGISTIMYMTERSAAPLAAVVVILGIGLAYTAILFFICRWDIHRYADTFYYLGFIFTLASLFVSFWPFIEDTTRSQLIVGQVLGNFGVALSSTVCGLILRIFFSRTAYDPGEVASTAQNDIASSVTSIANSLKDADNDVKKCLGTLRDDLSGSVKQVVDAAVASAEERVMVPATQEYEAAVKNITGALVSSINDLNQNTAKLGQAIEASATKLESFDPDKQFADAIGTFVKDLENKLAPLEVVIQLLQEKTESQAAAMEGLVTATQNTAAQTSGLAETLGKIPESFEGLKETGSTIGKINESMSETLNNLRDLKTNVRKNMDALETQVNIFKRRIQQAIEKWPLSEEVYTTISSGIDELARKVVDGTKDADSFISKLTELIKVITDKTKKMSPAGGKNKRS